MKTTVSLLTLLLATVMATGLLGCGSDSETVAESSDETSAPVRNLSAVKIPNGNIGCQFSEDSVRCDIRSRDYADPDPPADCPVDYGDSLRVGAAGPGEFVCHGDTAIDPSSAVLDQTSSVAVRGFICSGDPGGVTCTNQDTGHGFTLSRQEAKPF